MEFKARSIALTLAPAVAVLTSVSLFALGMVTALAALAAFAITLGVTYGLTYYLLKYRVFMRLNKVVRLLNPAIDSVEEGEPVAVSPKLLEQLEQQEKVIDELRRLESFRKDFIADIGHELKTPIFAAQGFVHTLLDGAVKDKSVRKKFLRKAARSLDGLDRLVQDLLTLSQIETGKVKMQFAVFDVYNLAEDVLDQFEEKISRKSIDVKIEGGRRTVAAYADMERIRQVLNNLVSNAIKYTSAGGRVRVVFEESPGYVTTHVRDTGRGIAAEHLDRVFQRFYRVDKSRNRERGGTGLGLAIVKHILEGHGSRAEVVSAPGKGSDFSFKLPGKAPAAPETTES